MNHYVNYWRSPLGIIELQANNQGLTHLYFVEEKKTGVSNAIIDNAIEQLDHYFQGRQKHFTCPLDPQGTAFQQSVWQQLQAIPHGRTVSYSDIAKQLGKPAAVRAVGAANGRNPISIIVPCHRVIGRNGHLTGYLGGIERKRWLLQHEHAL